MAKVAQAAKRASGTQPPAGPAGRFQQMRERRKSTGHAPHHRRARQLHAADTNFPAISNHHGRAIPGSVLVDGQNPATSPHPLRPAQARPHEFFLKQSRLDELRGVLCTWDVTGITSEEFNREPDCPSSEGMPTTEAPRDLDPGVPGPRLTSSVNFGSGPVIHEEL